jgi:ankyrin repeat protein
MCLKCRFMLECKKGNFQTVQRILNLKKELVNYKNKFRQTGLMLAAHGGYSDIVEFLLENKASVHEKDNNADTTMMMACKNGNLQCVKLLYKASRGKIENEDYCLRIAIQSENFQLVKYLLKKGVKSNGYAINIAVKLGNIEIVNLLCKKVESNISLDTMITQHKNIKLFLNNLPSQKLKPANK